MTYNVILFIRVQYWYLYRGYVTKLQIMLKILAFIKLYYANMDSNLILFQLLSPDKNFYMFQLIIRFIF